LLGIPNSSLFFWRCIWCWHYIIPPPVHSNWTTSTRCQPPNSRRLCTYWPLLSPLQLFWTDPWKSLLIQNQFLHYQFQLIIT